MNISQIIGLVCFIFAIHIAISNYRDARFYKEIERIIRESKEKQYL